MNKVLTILFRVLTLPIALVLVILFYIKAMLLTMWNYTVHGAELFVFRSGIPRGSINDLILYLNKVIVEERNLKLMEDGTLGRKAENIKFKDVPEGCKASAVCTGKGEYTIQLERNKDE